MSDVVRIPTTEAQQELWAAAQLGSAARLALHDAVALTFDGPLDRLALEHALAQIVARHEALRAQCTADGRELVVGTQCTLSIEQHDLRRVAAPDQPDALRAYQQTLVETPFALTEGPLVRVSLVTLSDVSHVLIIVAHQIVCDHWSFGTIARELGAVYSAYRRGAAASLPEPVSLARYVAELTSEAEGPEAGAAGAYWMGRFVQEVPPLELPTVHLRPPVRRFEAGRVDAPLSPELVAALRAATGDSDAARFHTMLAGFVALLHRLGSLDDLVVGIPASGRDRLGLTPLVGQCVELLPLRLQPQAEQRFAQLSESARQSLDEALAHRPLALGNLLTRLRLPRDASRLPLFNVVFDAVRELTSAELGFDGLATTCRMVPRTHGHFELFLTAVTSGDSIVLQLQFSRALFDDNTMQRWLGSYCELLATALAAPETVLGRLPILTATDRRLLEQFRFGPVMAVDESRLVHDRVGEVAARRPDAIATSFGDATRSYAALDHNANRIARDLRARGVRRDVPVGVLLPRDVRLPETIVGVLRAGGAYVPLDPDLPLARLHFLVRDARLAHIVTAASVRALLPTDVDVELLDLDADLERLALTDASPLEPSDADARPESVSFVIFTSGSTGVPKGCCNTHRGLLNFVCANEGRSGIFEGSVALAQAASGFDASVGEIIMALTSGAHLVIVPREVSTDGMRLSRTLRETNATFFFGSPATFQLLFAAGWRGHSGITVISGGETLTRDLAGAIAERAGDVWNVYGPTETAVWVSRSLVSPPPPRITIGAPMANSRFDVVDGFGVPVPVGIPGELFIAGPNVGRGYLHRDELTAERFLPDPLGSYPGSQRYRTGDIVRWLANGELEFIGRNDDQVKLRGFRVELGEIASRLEELPDVAAAIAMVRTSDDGDRRLVAYVQRAAGTNPDHAQLRRHLAAQLPTYMVPQAFVTLDAFPLLATGKVHRRALPPPPDRSLDDAPRGRAPETELERRLAEAWARALRVATVSADDDFFALGGHSLLASQIIAQLRTDHGLEIPYRLFFDAPTLSALAAAAEALAATGAPAPRSVPLVARPRGASAPVSITQRRLYMLETLDPTRRLVLAHGAAWRLEGPLDAAKLEGALTDVITRHDILRTRFVVIDDSLRQVVEPTVPFALHQDDLSTLPVADRDAAVLHAIDTLRTEPFDHATAPLFRALLVRLGPAEHVLFTQQHGLTWDGWSFDVFLDDLATAYSARRHGAAPSWAPLPVQYADYAEWQVEQLQSPAMARQVAWWRNHLGDAAPVLEIPADHPRSAQPSFEGGQVELRLEPDEVAQLRRVAQQQGATLFQLLFAAFHVQLHRYAGQQDIVVATPLRNRSRSEVSRLIGQFTNTVAVRSRITPEARFAAVLQAIRADCIQALEHEEMPFELLAQHAPAVRALFSMQDARSRPRDLDGCRLVPMALTDRSATNDLLLSIMEHASGLQLTLSYRSSLHEQATAMVMLEQFRSIVREVAVDPDVPVHRLTLHSDTVASSRPLAAPLAHEPLDVLLALAGSDANTSAVTWTPRGTVTRATLLDSISRLRSALMGHGVGPGDLVLCRTHDDSARLALQVASLQSGITLVLLAADDGDDYLRAVASAGAVSLIVTDRALTHPSVPTALLSVLTATPACDAPVSGHLPVAARAQIDATGVELVRFPSSALGHAVRATIDALRLTAHDTLLDLATAADEGPPLFALAALACDAQRFGSDHARSLEGAEIIELLAAASPTVMVAYEDSLRELERVNWSGGPELRVLVVGGCAPHRLTWLQGRVAEAHCATGLPDTLGVVALYTDASVSELPLLPSVCGMVLDIDDRPAPCGVRGTLVVASDTAAPQRTAAVARLRPDGVIVLRRDPGHERWIAGAMRSPTVLAARLRTATGASDAAIAWHDDATGHGRLVAYLAGGDTRADGDLRRLLRAVLPSWAIPAHVVWQEALPRLANGAVDIDALASPWRRTDVAPTRTAPETTAEQLLASLWCELLVVPHVRVSDNFFALGGHSLLVFRLIDRVQEQTGVRLAPRTLLFGTLERVAEELHAALQPVTA